MMIAAIKFTDLQINAKTTQTGMNNRLVKIWYCESFSQKGVNAAIEEIIMWPRKVSARD